MLIPLLVLKIAIALRNNHLAEDFPPTADERYSTEAVDDLLEKGVGCAFALPLVSGRPFDRLNGLDTTILGIDIKKNGESVFANGINESVRAESY